MFQTDSNVFFIDVVIRFLFGYYSVIIRLLFGYYCVYYLTKFTLWLWFFLV